MPVYISELRLESGKEFVEIVATDGEDVSGYSIAIYNQTGDLQYTHSLNGEYHSTVAGSDGYLINAADGLPNMGPQWGIALIDDLGNVVKFIGGDGNAVTATDGPAAGETSIAGPITPGNESLQSDDLGATYYAQSSPNPGTIPCYAPGTMIDTPDGPRAVETLRPGDLVQTVDNGPQPIRWVRSGDHPLEDAEVDDKPVLIQAGALGAGRPAQDLIVSPQHRVLVGGGGQLTDYFAAEAFAPAKALTELPGIRHMKGKPEITWVHFACDRHEVVIANGCHSESLLLGPMVLNGLNRSERAVLTDIFGPAFGHRAGLNGPAIRDCLKVGEVRRHLAKRKKENLKRTAKETSKWCRDLAMEQWEADQVG